MLHFLRHCCMMILKVERTLQCVKTTERNSTSCECIFHQLAAKNLNINVQCNLIWSLDKKNIIVFIIWPAIIFSPGDAMLCPFEGHKYGGQKPTETSVFEFSYKSMNSSLEELTKVKVIIIYSETRKVSISKSQKIGDVFINPHMNSPGCKLNAVSCKSLEIQASTIAK